MASYPHVASGLLLRVHKLMVLSGCSQGVLAYVVLPRWASTQPSVCEIYFPYFPASPANTSIYNADEEAPPVAVLPESVPTEDKTDGCTQRLRVSLQPDSEPCAKVPRKHLRLRWREQNHTHSPVHSFHAQIPSPAVRRWPVSSSFERE